MHEVSIAESIVQLINDAAEREGFSHVRTVWLEIGRLAAVEAEALRFCFEAVAAASPAAGAQLEIIELPGEGRCPQCGASSPMDDLLASCSACGSYGLRVTAGNEMRVKALDVEPNLEGNTPCAPPAAAATTD